MLYRDDFTEEEAKKYAEHKWGLYGASMSPFSHFFCRYQDYRDEGYYVEVTIPYGNSLIREILWCDEHNIHIGWGLDYRNQPPKNTAQVCFRNHDDAILFKLRWGGK